MQVTVHLILKSPVTILRTSFKPPPFLIETSIYLSFCKILWDPTRTFKWWRNISFMVVESNVYGYFNPTTCHMMILRYYFLRSISVFWHNSRFWATFTLPLVAKRMLELQRKKWKTCFVNPSWKSQWLIACSRTNSISTKTQFPKRYQQHKSITNDKTFWRTFNRKSDGAEI